MAFASTYYPPISHFEVQPINPHFCKREPYTAGAKSLKWAAKFVGESSWLARVIHWGRAVALENLNRYPEAVEAWSEVIGLSSKKNSFEPRALRSISRAKGGDHIQATKEIEEYIAEKKTNSDLYNAARVFSLSSSKVVDDAMLKEKYAKRAIELLIRAKEKDLFHEVIVIEELNKDPYFEPIRAREDYKKFLKELEKQK